MGSTSTATSNATTAVKVKVKAQVNRKRATRLRQARTALFDTSWAGDEPGSAADSV
jgi:hypothetical protein